MTKLTYNEFRHEFSKLTPLKQAGFFLWPSLKGNELSEKERNIIQEVQPSGFVLFRRNLSSFAQSQQLVSQLKQLSNYPNNSPLQKEPVVSIDEEGGRVSRLPPPFPRGFPALSFSKEHPQEDLISQTMHQCFVAKGLGINCLLAPVVDILTEPSNPVMGDRCFASDVDTVKTLSEVVYQTIVREGLLPCAKHFPGHGNTTTDSHKTLPVSLVDEKTLKDREWKTFEHLIQQKIPLIMAAHVLLPLIDPKAPATLSYRILTEQLRHELKFEGLILSDDLRMNAIAEHYHIQKEQDVCIIEEVNHNSKEQNDDYLQLAALDALKAGCDIILCCQSIEKEFPIAKAIARAIEQESASSDFFIQKAYHIHSILSAERKDSTQ